MQMLNLLFPSGHVWIKHPLHGTHVMPIGSIPLLSYKPIDEYGLQEYKMWIAWQVSQIKKGL